MTRGCRRIGRLAAVLALAGCGEPVRDLEIGVRRSVAAPVAEPSPGCGEVGALRVCWAADGAALGVTKPPAARDAPAGPLGFRCEGDGAARRCTDRTGTAAPFRCEGERCAQLPARVPDTDEWECVDRAGAVVCLGRAGGAGVAPGGATPGFTCGQRLLGGAPSAERICVDLSPDLPPGEGPWRCAFERRRALARLCEVAPDAPLIGLPCGEGRRACIDGTSCVEGRCVPPRPAPACWLDQDCRSARCRFGSCVEDAR